VFKLPGINRLVKAANAAMTECELIALHQLHTFLSVTGLILNNILEVIFGYMYMKSVD
jgi:hypothetical protein